MKKSSLENRKKTPKKPKKQFTCCKVESRLPKFSVPENKQNSEH